MPLSGHGVSGQGLRGVTEHSGISNIGGLLAAKALLWYDFANDQNIDRITFTRGSSGTYFDSNGLLQTATTNVARFDHDPVTGSPLGLLIEEQRENLALSSEDASDNTGELRVTVSTNTTVAPDGNTTMDSILETADTNTHHLDYDTITVSSSTDYVLSFFFLALNNGFVAFDALENGGSLLSPGILVNLSTGAVVSSDGSDNTFVTDVGGGIWRVGIGFETESDTTTVVPRVFTNVDGTNEKQNYEGNTSNGVIVWGKVLEEGAFPSSYIKTTTGAVTRSADVATIALSGVPGFSETTLTVYIEYLRDNSGLDKTLWQLDDGTAGERYAVQFDGTVADRITTRVVSSSTNTAVLFKNGSTANATHKVSCAIDANAIAISLDGGAVGTDSSIVLPSGLTTLRFGKSSGTNLLGGHIARLVYWNSRLSDAQLQALTT